MVEVVHACAIIHNILCADRKCLYSGIRKARVILENEPSLQAQLTHHAVQRPTKKYALVEWLHQHVVPLEDGAQKEILKNALIENMWNHVASSVNEPGGGDDDT